MIPVFLRPRLHRVLPLAVGLVVVGVAVAVSFSQSLADRWALLPLGRLTAPLGGFEVHVVMWGVVGLATLKIRSSAPHQSLSRLGVAFLASLSFEVAQPIFTPRNFEIADLSANVVGLSLAGWWHRRAVGEAVGR